MPKQVLQVTSFSGGLNSYKDARDIENEQYVQNWNAMVDQEGVIRVSGMAENYIPTDYHNNDNFEAGYGLFQFATDYSITQIDGNFSGGITSGTLSSSSGSTTQHSLAIQTSTSATDDYYNDMILFIYSGTGKGESRKITDYDYTGGAIERMITTEAFVSSLDNTSKYIIYRWKVSDNWFGSAAKKDFITDGSIDYYEAISTINENDYYIYTKNNVADNTSETLGNIQYPANSTTSQLTIKPGVQYYLTFDCAARQKWTNSVSDGEQDGSGSPYGDKVPWVQLYSTDVSDSSGCVRTIAQPVSPPSDWENNQTYQSVSQSETSGNGRGAIFTVITDGSGVPTAYMKHESKGTGYAVNDTIKLLEPVTNDDLTITVSAINTVGLSLYEHSWVSLSDQAGYISLTDVNFVDNGDFADNAPSDTTDNSGNAIAWTQVGSNITCSALNSNGYDGVDGTLEMSANTSFSYTNNEPDSYIYQTLTLDTLTPYHLNFLYDTYQGMKYAIYDSTNSVYLKGWTELEYTRNFDDDKKYRFIGADTNSIFKDNGLGYDMQYIKFEAPFKANATETTIQIRLSCIGNNTNTRVHGVTVFKAHNDLVTMAYQSLTVSPFSDSISNFNKYYIPIKLSESFSEVNTWKLILHAGHYGYRTDSNTLEAGDTQEVYFDNIKLTSEEGDVITLLSNNDSRYSCINAYSNSSETWNLDLIRWEETKARPVYNYINGMLKISDANFNTSNSNKLLFYQDRKFLSTNIHDGWVIKDNPIAPAPSINVTQSFDDNINPFNYNAIPFLNEYFKNTFWGTTETSTPYVTTRVYQPGGWPMDAFGTTVDNSNLTIAEKITTSGAGGNLKGKYNGLVLRHKSQREHAVNEGSLSDGDIWGTVIGYVTQDPKQIKGNGEGRSGPAENYNSWHVDATTRYMFDTTKPWFSDNIEPGGTYYLGHKGDITLSNRGWRSGQDYKNVYHDGNGQNVDIGVRARQPVQFIIKGSDLEYSEYTLNENAPNDTKSIASIRLIFNHIQQGGQFWSHAAHPPVPVVVKVGFPSDAVSDVKQALIAGDVIPMSTVLAQENVGVLSDEVRDSWTFNIYDYQGSPQDLCKNGYIVGYTGGEGTNASGYPCINNYSIDMTLNFTPGQIHKDDIILLSITDTYSGDINNLPLEWGYNDGKWLTAFNATLGSGYWNNGRFTEDNKSFWDRDESSCYLGGPEYQYHWMSAYTTFKISAIDIRLYNDNSEENTIETRISNGASAQAEFEFGTPGNVSTTGWGGRTFKVATTSVNIFNEESSLTESFAEIGSSDDALEIPIGQCPNIHVKLGDKQYKDPYIIKTKFYMKDSLTDIYYLQFYIDHNTKKLYSSTSNKTAIANYSRADGVTSWYLEREHFKDFNEINSYESETMVSQEDATKDSNLIARYKTSVIVNNRLYAGNIYQNGKIYGDRMLKSPIGKYNLLPASNFIDVAINDGDEITALAYYQDKLLQFKKRKVFVINTSGDYEFLEETFDNVGVNLQASVTTTPYGICWANKTGCYLYDGNKLTNLIDKVIAPTTEYDSVGTNYWLASASTLSNMPTLAYLEVRDSIILKWSAENYPGSGVTPDSASYHFATKSWSYNVRSIIGDTAQAVTGKTSNMISDSNGDVIYYRGQADAYDGIKKWSHGPTSVNPSGGTALKTFFWTSKDFTFGDISARKKIHKVYITYKCSADSKVLVKAQVNGLKNFDGSPIDFDASTSKFAGTADTACYHASNGLLSTGDVWKTAELKFDTPSEVNNIYSLQLRLGASSSINVDFEVNDISIVYRTKNIK
jgi:hypothetical protein